MFYFSVSYRQSICINMNTIKLICEQCGNSFDRFLKYHKRNSKNGSKTFCGRACARIYSNLHMPPEFYKQNAPRMRSLAGNRRDEFSPFRRFISDCRQRRKECNITPEYLKQIWECQNGICPYTGFKLELPRRSSKHYYFKQASLDRIDSSKGYIEGNVEFVCLPINLAKNKYTKTEIIEFIAELIKNGATGKI